MSYTPIANYGFIGNLRTCALVSKEGSIDWCCLPCLDSPSVFAAILDDDKGGSWQITPRDECTDIKQAYVGQTNVLRTIFTTATGAVELIDWFHMGEFSYQETDEHRRPILYRLVRCTTGSVDLQIRFDPRCNYARAEMSLQLDDNGVLACATGDHLHLLATADWQCGDDGATTTVSLKADEEWSACCVYGSDISTVPNAHDSLASTTAYWERWIHDCEVGECPFIGPWHKDAIRSLLTLKILAGGDGIAAAATTSLPEIMGGGDNWDYRYNWIRDTSFTIQAFTQMGHHDDAREYLDWLCTLLHDHGVRPSEIKILYPLRSLHTTPEEELTHLSGYCNSQPVRIGNAAEDQKQWDIYGEIMETVYRSEHLHPEIDDRLRGALIGIVDYVVEIWREPDHGIWELRQDPQHHLYSKVMCWVALDRGIKLAESHEWSVDTAHWKAERDELQAMIMERGYSEERQCFRQAFDSEDIDATALLFPLLEFIPPDHPYTISTIRTIQKELTVDGLVYRSDYHKDREGAFLFCSFWLVNALALIDELDEAQALFEKLLGHGNHLGLYAEEIDPKTGEFLGNFPQAFTHVGLINSAVYLGLAKTNKASGLHLMGEEWLRKTE